MSEFQTIKLRTEDIDLLKQLLLSVYDSMNIKVGDLHEEQMRLKGVAAKYYTLYEELSDDILDFDTTVRQETADRINSGEGQRTRI